MLTLLALAAGLACGCAGDARKGTVTGRVTLDGKPIEHGTIQFFPVDGKGQTASGDIQDGSYGTEVPVGLMRVEINASKVAGRRKAYDTPDSPLMEIYEETIPPKYNSQSQLTTQVAPGSNEASFDLKGR